MNLRKIFVVLIAVMLLLSCVPSFCVTASADIEDVFDFAYSYGVMVVSGCNKNAKGDIQIPSTYGGYPVKAIGKGAFSGCSSIQTIQIPSSVVQIGDNAFENCTSLTSIVLLDFVHTLGASAFKGCRSMRTAVLPNSISTIEKSLFEDCISLTSVNIPPSVTTIKSNAFKNCISLRSISIPVSVSTIEEQVFEGCSALKHIYYDGDEIQKTGITIEENAVLLNAEWKYNTLDVNTDAQLMNEDMNTATLPPWVWAVCGVGGTAVVFAIVFAVLLFKNRR